MEQLKTSTKFLLTEEARWNTSCFFLQCWWRIMLLWLTRWSRPEVLSFLAYNVCIYWCTFRLTVYSVITLHNQSNALLVAGLCTADSVMCVRCDRVHKRDLLKRRGSFFVNKLKLNFLQIWLAHMHTHHALAWNWSTVRFTELLASLAGRQEIP